MDESHGRDSQVSHACPEMPRAPYCFWLPVSQPYCLLRTLSSAPTVAASACPSQALASARAAVSHTLISL